MLPGYDLLSDMLPEGFDQSRPPRFARLSHSSRDAKTGVPESDLPFSLDEGTGGRNARSDLYRQGVDAS